MKFLLPVWKFLLVCLLQTTSRIDKEMHEGALLTATVNVTQHIYIYNLYVCQHTDVVQMYLNNVS